jgi:hypothetical protein
MESDYCVAMVMHGDGALLNVLKRLVKDESDEGSCEKCVIQCTVLIINM